MCESRTHSLVPGIAYYYIDLNSDPSVKCVRMSNYNVTNPFDDFKFARIRIVLFKYNPNIYELQLNSIVKYACHFVSIYTSVYSDFTHKKKTPTQQPVILV